MRLRVDARRVNIGAGASIAAFGLVLSAGLSAPPAHAQGKCTSTALRSFDACLSDAVDDFKLSRAICINESNRDDRSDCRLDAFEERQESRSLCREQRSARRDLCRKIGEARYDPDFDPADFEPDPTSIPEEALNRFFPLAVGNTRTYTGDGESVIVEVLDETKLIEDVRCIVVNDIALEDGEVVEDTDDWYAQAVTGDVWYCGEISRNFELFEGDDPEDPELVDVDGSWKAGRDGARPGILIRAAPVVGETYRQEFAAGDAEDAATVLAVDYAFGNDPDLDAFVPQELADLLCAGDCVVTEEFTPLEPDTLEYKYYAPGIGLFLEVDPESGDIVQLTDCNFDLVCGSLPAF
jgi:hypothetical protein